MDKVIYKDRKNTNSIKWDTCGERFGSQDLLPLWIADMDFEVPLCVKDALKEYVDFGVYGYYTPPGGYMKAFINWERNYHNYEVKEEWLRFSPGVVPAINWIVHILTEKKDGVIITPPVYHPFREAVVSNNRILVESTLTQSKGRYLMDYDDFEQKIKNHHVKLFVFCSPHNPVGRVWEVEEIRKVLDICKKHQVYVIADEIHQDIVMKGYRHIPAATTGDYDDMLVTLTAATKTFNLAACQNSIVIIPNEEIRAMYDEYLNRLRIKEGNAFGYIAVQSAYENGREWLESVLEIVESNFQIMKNILQLYLQDIYIADLEGTYLMWIDLSAYLKPEEIEQKLESQCGLAVNYGRIFGKQEYAGFIRVNLATKPENIAQAAYKIVKAIQK